MVGPPTLLEDCTPDVRGDDCSDRAAVGVIGGGPSGAYAAVTLRRHFNQLRDFGDGLVAPAGPKRDIVVLEGTHDIGGLVKTYNSEKEGHGDRVFDLAAIIVGGDTAYKTTIEECKRHKLRLWSDKGVNAYWSCQKKFKDFKNTEEYWGESPMWLVFCTFVYMIISFATRASRFQAFASNRIHARLHGFKSIAHYVEKMGATCLRPMFYVAFSLYGYGWLERVSVRHCMTFFGYEYLVDHVLKLYQFYRHGTCQLGWYKIDVGFYGLTKCLFKEADPEIRFGEKVTKIVPNYQGTGKIAVFSQKNVESSHMWEGRFACWRNRVEKAQYETRFLAGVSDYTCVNSAEQKQYLKTYFNAQLFKKTPEELSAYNSSSCVSGPSEMASGSLLSTEELDEQLISDFEGAKKGPSGDLGEDHIFSQSTAASVNLPSMPSLGLEIADYEQDSEIAENTPVADSENCESEKALPLLLTETQEGGVKAGPANEGARKNFEMAAGTSEKQDSEKKNLSKDKDGDQKQNMVLLDKIVLTAGLKWVDIQYSDPAARAALKFIQDDIEYSPYSTTVVECKNHCFGKADCNLVVQDPYKAHPHEPWMIYRRYCEAGKQDDHWIIYSYGDTMDPKIYAQVMEQIKLKLPQKYGLEVLQIVAHNSAGTYFPRPKSELESGDCGPFFEKVQQLQGKNGIYLAGTLLSFENYENALNTSKKVVDKLIADEKEEGQKAAKNYHHAKSKDV